MRPMGTSNMTRRQWLHLVAARAAVDPRSVDKVTRMGRGAVRGAAGERIDLAIAQLAAEGFEQPAAPEIDRAA